MVRDADGHIAQESLTNGDVARGGDLFRLNCASCHNFTGKGGALSSGKYAPDLGEATPQQIYTAMLTGPQNMPKFSDRQLSPEEKSDIVTYVRESAEARSLRTRLRGNVHVDWRHGRLDRHRDVDWSPDMSNSDVPGQPSDAELAQMSNDELLALGGKLDGVDIVFKEDRWPVEGTRAEKRAERSVARWLLFGGLCGLALLIVFLFWPWEYDPDSWWYALATPMYGLTFGLSILAIGIGAVLFQKKFIPEEITIQDRHDGASTARPSWPT